MRLPSMKSGKIVDGSVADKKETPSKGCLMKCYMNKALQRRVIRVSEMFVEH